MEKVLIQWCMRQWERKRVVTRGIIFRRALQYLPSHCGGNENPTLFKSLKHWFYAGFKNRCKLSKRRVSSTGQKMPKNADDLHRSIIGRLAATQAPTMFPDGSRKEGVPDKRVGNTDQVPVYIEDHSKATWGLKGDRERRLVGTAGKDKDRFTTQLTCFKDGDKVTLCAVVYISFSSAYLQLF
jgi:hypothetical protein